MTESLNVLGLNLPSYHYKCLVEAMRPLEETAKKSLSVPGPTIVSKPQQVQYATD